MNRVACLFRPLEGLDHPKEIGFQKFIDWGHRIGAYFSIEIKGGPQEVVGAVREVELSRRSRVPFNEEKNAAHVVVFLDEELINIAGLFIVPIGEVESIAAQVFPICLIFNRGIAAVEPAVKIFEIEVEPTGVGRGFVKETLVLLDLRVFRILEGESAVFLVKLLVSLFGVLHFGKGPRFGRGRRGVATTA